MEKFLLHSLLACNGLDIVHEQKVCIAVLLMEAYGILIFKCSYQFIYKAFACGIDYFQLGMVPAYLILDGFHQMSFAKSRITVDYQGVEDLIWVDILSTLDLFIILIGNCFTESVCKFI